MSQQTTITNVPPVQHLSSTLPPAPTKMGGIIQSTGTIKKILPIVAFFVGFITVMTILLIYMDNTAMRHYQFRVNMSQDYELLEVKQDNPQLIAYIRQMHLQPAKEAYNEINENTLDAPDEDVTYILQLLSNKHEGIFIESGAYDDGKTSKTAWLEKKLSWKGLLIQPDPRHYFNLRKHNREKSQAVHACLSPSPYPKEVSFHQEEKDGVKINSIHSNCIMDDSDIFNTRVKCFPLYSLLLAMNITDIDYLSLETGGTELQVLETIPFEKVRIQVINVHLDNKEVEEETIKKFLATKNYLFMKKINKNYIFFIKR